MQVISKARRDWGEVTACRLSFALQSFLDIFALKNGENCTCNKWIASRFVVTWVWFHLLTRMILTGYTYICSRCDQTKTSIGVIFPFNTRAQCVQFVATNIAFGFRSQNYTLYSFLPVGIPSFIVTCSANVPSCTVDTSSTEFVLDLVRITIPKIVTTIKNSQILSRNMNTYRLHIVFFF